MSLILIFLNRFVQKHVLKPLQTCLEFSLNLYLFSDSNRGRPGSPGHLVLHIHQLQQFHYRTIILPYERREYTFCLGGVTIDMEKGIIEVRFYQISNQRTGKLPLVFNIQLIIS